ncbi:hypothetical protein LTR24_009934 [Lithohypha guttulata]|uniref:Uncharacterized protein n=1 Tax=Lithohypha guttulata TaxID=1690604 RepID=A0ABR0JX39_9EURO|nr:hypothetical protein LTR24_009934 [Lithohypha guttulata]
MAPKGKSSSSSSTSGKAPKSLSGSSTHHSVDVSSPMFWGTIIGVCIFLLLMGVSSYFWRQLKRHRSAQRAGSPPF